MRCAIGIDLGSTTTKAVVLGESGEPLGRGITNSRSNYDLAASVALEEAMVASRFGLLEPAAREVAGPGVLAGLEKAFRHEQLLEQLERLETAMRIHAERSVPAPLRRAADLALREICCRIREEEEIRLQDPFASLRSDFFRDAAGSAFARLAEQRAGTDGLSFELLLGVYDASIVEVENEPPTRSFAEHIDAALSRIAAPGTLRRAVDASLAVPLERAAMVGTGYGRARLPFPKEQIRSEILCHGLGAHAMFPGTRTVLDIGGQDTKAIQVDENGIVTGFQMNDRCAAGCGRYLGYIADEMSLGLHELGPMAARARRCVRINSTCTVFAGAEVRELLSLGERREDILAGLHRAIMLRAMSLLARSGGVTNEFTFTGGVARNEAAVRALRDLTAENYGEMTLNISEDSIYTGALGAALFAHRMVS